MLLTIHLWNPYDKTNNLTLFSEKLENVSVFDPCKTLKVNDGLGYQKNVAYGLFTLFTKSHTFNRYCTLHNKATSLCLAALLDGLNKYKRFHFTYNIVMKRHFNFKWSSNLVSYIVGSWWRNVRVCLFNSVEMHYTCSTLIKVMLFIPWHPISLYWGGHCPVSNNSFGSVWFGHG